MPKNNQRNLQQDIAIAKIQKDIEFIKREISNIKDNRLAKIYSRMESQKTLLISTLITVILLLLGTILNLIIR